LTLSDPKFGSVPSGDTLYNNYIRQKLSMGGFSLFDGISRYSLPDEALQGDSAPAAKYKPEVVQARIDHLTREQAANMRLELRSRSISHIVLG